MGKIPALASTQIDELRRLDSATVSNAVESFGVRIAAIQRPGDGDQDLREIGEDPPIMRFVRVGQR